MRIYAYKSIFVISVSMINAIIPVSTWNIYTIQCQTCGKRRGEGERKTHIHTYRYTHRHIHAHKHTHKYIYIYIYSAKKIRVHVFICIFQLFKLITDISVWYLLKEHSNPRLMWGWSCGYDYYERFRSWLNDIPPKSKSHKK